MAALDTLRHRLNYASIRLISSTFSINLLSGSRARKCVMAGRASLYTTLVKISSLQSFPRKLTERGNCKLIRTAIELQKGLSRKV